MASELPESIRDLSNRVAAITSARSTQDLAEVLQLMVAQLHIAVHGDTWARPETPQQVWLDLLAEVARMKAAT